ncbi:MAG: 3-methyladenine DNA glycosylase [Phylliscum demangeonii]|nr:MAG: 3-methyladenine DNA glycosylase [Phylliscum demangeonii]
MSLRRSSRIDALQAARSVLTQTTTSPRLEPHANQATPPRRRKTAPAAPPSNAQHAEAPCTPPRKRARIAAAGATATATATPTAVRLMTAPAGPAMAAKLGRLAEPHVANAPVMSPDTQRVVRYSDAVLHDSASASPSTARLPAPTTTTSHLLEEACAHLVRMDPRLQAVIAQHPCHLFSPDALAEPIDPFRSLTTGIIAQQVSGAAATSIKNKFVALFVDEPTPAPAPAPGPASSDFESRATRAFPTPSQVAACDLARLRTAGLSGRKAEYIHGLAERFVSGELSAEMLVRASDEEVLTTLTAVRGLGRWSVEMFACFALKRFDVFSTGDLGVQRGMAAWLGKDVSRLKAKGGGKWKYLSEKEMLEHSAKFAPYRSLFMWYMWRVENVDIKALQSP